MLTTRIVTGSKKDTSGRLSFSNDMARGRCTQNAILSNQKLLHAIGSPDPRNQLYDFGIIKPAITSNHQKAALDSLGDG